MRTHWKERMAQQLIALVIAICWVLHLQGELRGAWADPNAHDRVNDRRQASEESISEGVAAKLVMCICVARQVRLHLVLQCL